MGTPKSITPRRSRAVFFTALILLGTLALAIGMFMFFTIRIESQRAVATRNATVVAVQAAKSAASARVDTTKALKIATRLSLEIDHARIIAYLHASLRWFRCLDVLEHKYLVMSASTYHFKRTMCFDQYGAEVRGIKLELLDR